jgi:GNAT superfamily N-acetyltransferase
VSDGSLLVRGLLETDLGAAEDIWRRAFGTVFAVPDPATFRSDVDYVRGRWRADPTAAFVAEIDGVVVGSSFAARWGSVGFFGPLTVHPDYWDRGVGQRLLVPTLACLDHWGVTHAGLFTFPHSTKHVGLYQRYGFWPRFLTALLATPVDRPATVPDWSLFSTADRTSTLAACRDVTDAVYLGLDLEREILAVSDQGLGDTVLLWTRGRLDGLAVCHCGPGTEAGTDICYVKFGAVRPGPDAAATFEHLLDACLLFAAERGLPRLVAGVNLARHDAYQRLLARGFRALMQGVTMHRQNQPGYSHPDAYVLDDWR